MTDESLPIRVVVLEDDPLARVSTRRLLSRDLRTEVLESFSEPAALLSWLQKRSRRSLPGQLPHIVLVDPEYEAEPEPLTLVAELRGQHPAAAILFLSQYGDRELLHGAVRAGVDGFALKREIGLAVATAVYLAYHQGPVYSAALAPRLRALAADPVVRAWWEGGRSLPRWRAMNHLSSRLQDIAWHCLFYGMSNRLAGEELALANGSVETYRTRLYDEVELLAAAWLDLEPLRPVLPRLTRARPKAGPERLNEDLYTGDDWAFHMLTQLPRQIV